MDEDNPITRRLGAVGMTEDGDGTDHDQVIEEGLEALKHPSVPHHHRMAAASILLAVKHFSMHGKEIPHKVMAHFPGGSNADK